MKKNPVQFVVVREDPQIEMDMIGNFDLRRATLIGSGGCTAFCLKALDPDLEISLIEPHPAKDRWRSAGSRRTGILFSRATFRKRGNFAFAFR